MSIDGNWSVVEFEVCIKFNNNYEVGDFFSCEWCVINNKWY